MTLRLAKRNSSELLEFARFPTPKNLRTAVMSLNYKEDEFLEFLSYNKLHTSNFNLIVLQEFWAPQNARLEPQTDVEGAEVRHQKPPILSDRSKYKMMTTMMVSPFIQMNQESLEKKKNEKRKIDDVDSDCTGSGDENTSKELR
jgi:hypothetical protein